jgi:cystathionine beta-synthase
VNNPLAHEYTTGPEIIEDVVVTPSTPLRPSSGKVDAFVAGAGTGGTVTGVSRALKKGHNPECIVIAIDPVGCSGALLLTRSLTSTIERKHPGPRCTE